MTSNSNQMYIISNQINKLQQKRSNLLMETRKTEIQIQDLQDSLENICEHNWEVDSSAYDHHTCYECKRCGASR